MIENTGTASSSGGRKGTATKGSISLTVDWEKGAWLVLVLVAVVTRFYGLGDRVISHDESLHTYYSWELLQGRGFEHTPLMHGPFQFHVVALSFFLFGDSDFTARIPAAMFGIVAMGLLWCFRESIGRIGAYCAAVLLTVSPIILYYSRYVRNEAFAMVWALLMIISVVRYCKNRKREWLYLLAGVMALSHATKEVAFIYDAILMFYLGCILVRDNVQQHWEKPILKRAFQLLLIAMALSVAVVGILLMYERGGSPQSEGGGSVITGTSPRVILASGAAVGFGLAAVSVVVRSRWRRMRNSAIFDLLVVMGTLVLPQLVAFPVRVVFNADPLDYSTDGMLTTGAVLVALVLLSSVIGLVWNWRKWALCAGIFYAIYLFLFTTMFSNGGGIATGMVGSLGYWMVQQGVQRGNQPWYYYTLLQVPIYEFLPGIGTLIAAWWMVFRSRMQSHRNENAMVTGGRVFRVVPFLLYWVIAATLIYTLAGEKMPWLTVHIALPMVLLAGWMFDKWYRLVDWSVLRSGRSMIAAVLMILGFTSLFNVIGGFSGTDTPFQGTALAELKTSAGFLSGLVVFVGTMVGVLGLGRKIGLGNVGHLLVAVVVMTLGLLTVRASISANYLRYDEQTEFINYASGAPGIRVVMDDVEEISRRVTDGLGIRVAYDDDVSWPFTWYLRDYPNQVYFGGEPSRENFRNTPLVIAGNDNWSKVEAMLGNEYHSFEYIRMWWPMQDYFDLTFDRVRTNLFDPGRRASLWDIWYRRDYTRYGIIHGTDFSLNNWPVVDRMRFYVEKDLAARLWDRGIGSGVLVESTEPDPYVVLSRTRAAGRMWGVGGDGVGEFNSPRDVAVGPDGFVYVSDTFNHRIQKFDADGKFMMEWGVFGVVNGGEGQLGALNEPWGITVSDDGFVYVADTWNHRIQKFTSFGEPVLAWGRFGDEEELIHMWGPRAVAIGPEGHVFVADTGNKRVSVFTPQGEGVRQIGSGGSLDGLLDEPVGVAVGDDGIVFVADTWNGRIQVFDGKGSYLRQWESPGWHGQSLDNKPYVAVDGRGRVFASDPEGYRIIVWDSGGNALQVWGDYGNSASALNLPTGIGVDHHGGLYVTDSGNNRVLYFGPE